MASADIFLLGYESKTWHAMVFWLAFNVFIFPFSPLSLSPFYVCLSYDVNREQPQLHANPRFHSGVRKRWKLYYVETPAKDFITSRVFEIPMISTKFVGWKIPIKILDKRQIIYRQSSKSHKMLIAPNPNIHVYLCYFRCWEEYGGWIECNKAKHMNYMPREL